MQRLEFIHACQTSGDSFSAVCRHFCISRKTGYKWLKRFQPDDVSSLEDHSRAPLTHARQHSSDVINCLILLRRAHPDWGPNKIRQWLLNHEIPFDVPAGSTIGDILKREGLVPDRIKRRKTPENTHAL
ncbi:helix-turn-helix domain-containing protein, partial [Serratia liquefaciens]|uniref:helix-turn-helix domain-containing protein n=1 Tax=Serratia liquefaciens TaxID=614 RepID=UPI0021C63E6F